MCICKSPCACSACGGQKRTLNLELKLYPVRNCHMGDRNQTWVLCKNSQYSYRWAISSLLICVSYIVSFMFFLCSCFPSQLLIYIWNIHIFNKKNHLYVFFGGGDFINCFICPQTNLSGNFLWLCIFELRHGVFLYSLGWPQSCDLLRGLPSTRSTTYSTKPPLCFKTIFVALKSQISRSVFYSKPRQSRLMVECIFGRQRLESSHGPLPSKCPSYRHTA